MHALRCIPAVRFPLVSLHIVHVTSVLVGVCPSDRASCLDVTVSGHVCVLY